MSLLLITTGWVIDSHRDNRQQMIAPLRHTLVPETMHKTWLSYDDHLALCLKDARDIDENDLIRLFDIIHTAHHDRIIITYGYQTMANTIKRITSHRIHKHIVFVDSRTPLSEPDTDGIDQLTTAHTIITHSDTPSITVIRNNTPITVDALQHLQYQGKIYNKRCI